MAQPPANPEIIENPAYPMTVPGRRLQFHAPDRLNVRLIGNHLSEIYSAVNRMIETGHDLRGNPLTEEEIGGPDGLAALRNEINSALEQIIERQMWVLRAWPDIQEEYPWFRLLRDTLIPLERDYEREGYLYFGAFAASNPYYQAYLRRLPLTPANFEIASTTPLPLYRRILQHLRNMPNLSQLDSPIQRMSHLEPFVRTMPWSRFQPFSPGPTVNPPRVSIFKTDRDLRRLSGIVSLNPLRIGQLNETIPDNLLKSRPLKAILSHEIHQSMDGGNVI